MKNVIFQTDPDYAQIAKEAMEYQAVDLANLIGFSDYKLDTSLLSSTHGPVFYKSYPAITYYIIVHLTEDGWRIETFASVQHPSKTTSYMGRYYNNKVFEVAKFEEVALKALMMTQDGQ